MKVNHLTILLFIINSIGCISCAKILGIVGMPSYSHQVAFRQLWKELSQRGHQVTVMTTDPMEDHTLTNLTEINWNDSYDIIKQHDVISYMAEHKLQFWKIFEKFDDMTYDLLEYQMAHPEVKKLLQDKTISFDVVLMEMFFIPHAGFSVKFNCPYIGLTSLDAPTYLHDIMGNPTNPAMYPDFLLPLEGRLTLLERIGTFIFQVILQFYVLGSLSYEDALIKKYFGKDMPSTVELTKKSSLLFINVNPMLRTVRPVTPATVLIGGGTHLAASKALPKVGEY